MQSGIPVLLLLLELEHVPANLMFRGDAEYVKQVCVHHAGRSQAQLSPQSEAQHPSNVQAGPATNQATNRLLKRNK